MNTRSFAFFLLSLLGLWILPQAHALPPAKPTDGSVRFTRVRMTNPPGPTSTYYDNILFHSYHLRWKDNSPGADGTEVQLRFANAGAFFFLTNDQRSFLKTGTGIPDITERDADGYREAIVTVGSPPVGTICQFQIVTWKFNGSKTESSSLLIQTRVPAPNGNADFAPPTNLQKTVSSDADQATLTWEDKSDKEWFYELFLAEGSNPTLFKSLGYIPFGYTKWDLKRNMSFAYNATTGGQSIATKTQLIPDTTYTVALRAIKTIPPITVPLILGNTLPSASSNVTPAATVSFLMPGLDSPTNLRGSTIDEASVLLSWDDNSNNETGYEIQYRPITSGIPPAFSRFGEVGENINSTRVSLGQSGTAEFRVVTIYAYRPTGAATDTIIRSLNATNTIQLSTNEFLPPTSATATTSGMSGSVDLTWVDNSTTEVGFDVLCRPSGTTGDYARCVSLPDNVTKVTVNQFTSTKDAIGKPLFTNLAIGTSYDFIVRAVGTNEAVSSSSSNVVTATPHHGFTSRMHQPITQGILFNHNVTTSAAATSITAVGLPNGLDISPSTGVISGTPTQSGVFPVTLNATFSSGPDAISVLTLRVQPFSTEQIQFKSPTVASVIQNLTIGINQPYTISLVDKFTDADSETAVRWETTKGNIDFLLYPSLAPLAVANFMAYVNAGDYTNVFFHRNALQSDDVTPFVLQAGGFSAVDSIISVAGRPSPINEPGISNLKWTIAAAKRGARNSQTNDTVKNAYKATNPQFPAAAELTDGDFGYFGNPDSATTDIFINLNNNDSNLDNQNGGFTAYGRISMASQPTVTSIQSLPVGNYGGALTRLPVDVVGSAAPANPTFAQLVRIKKASSIPILTYSVDNLSPEVASVVVENDQLKLTGKIAGTRTVTVTAKDLDDKLITQTFTVTIDSAYQTPTITTQPSSQIITAGTTATLTVTATGTNLSYKWRKNGMEIVPSETSASLSLTSFDSADAADYDVIVYNANTSLSSDKATLSLRSPAEITGMLPSRIVEVGKPLEIDASITGSPDPACVWRRDTTIITGQTSRKLLIPAAKLSDAGIYTVTASNIGGPSAPGAGGSATVIVVDKTTQYQNVKVSMPVKLIAPVAGPGLTYQWKKGGLNIEISETGFSGQQDDTLIINSATTGNIGDYTCVVDAPAGLGSVETGIIRLSVPSQKPILAPFVLPNAVVGVSYRFQIEVAAGSSQSGAPGKFTVSGLPKGLSCDANTGFISGIPRATGNFSVKAIVSNAVGSATPATSLLKVATLFKAASGRYVARVSPSQPLNLNLGGRLDVSLTDNSAYTASLQLAGETFRSAGAFNLTSVNSDYSSGIYQSLITFNRANRKSIRALLVITTSTGQVEGVISDDVNASSVFGYRQAWDARFRSGPFIDYPFAAATGSYKISNRFNIALEPEVERIGQTDTPEGSGFLTLMVNNGGVATAVGRLSDGTPFTASTLISSSAEMYLFQVLNLNTSSLGGYVSLNTPLSGNLRWIKGRQPLAERIYQPGFSPTTLNAFGSIYTPPATNTNALQVTEADKNARITFTRGGLASIDPNLFIKVSPKNAVIYPTDNPAKVSLTISPSTGLISGSFELNTPEKRKASYQGLIVQKLEITQNPIAVKKLPPTGIGHFLLPSLTPTVATSAIKSGLVSMNGILISKQPDSQNVATGANVTFSVEALVIADLTALTYQWQKNGVSLSDGSGIAGATTKTLTLETVDNADAADYTCLIKSGTEIQAITQVAKLALVVSNVVASRTPNTEQLPAFSSVTFSVTANGSGVLTYVWLKNGVIIPKATSSSYTIASTTAADDGLYMVRVSSKTTPSGLTSNVVNLNINPITTVTASRQAPTDLNTILAKTSVTLNASVSAGETVTRYQWRKNGVAIRGATASTYTFVTGSSSSTNNYDVLAINPLAPTGIASNSLPVTVLTPVSNARVTRTSPTTAVVVVGSPFTLTASASGGSLTYQWKKNNVDIPSETGPTYTFTPAVAETAQYSVTVKNPLTPISGTGSEGVTSAALTVVIQVPISSPVLSRTAPAGATVPFNTPVTLSVTAIGTDPTYQWFRGTTLITGAINATYEFTSGAEANTTNYSVRVTNGTSAAGVLSNVLAVQVAPAP